MYLFFLCVYNVMTFGNDIFGLRKKDDKKDNFFRMIFLLPFFCVIIVFETRLTDSLFLFLSEADRRLSLQGSPAFIRQLKIGEPNDQI